MELGPTRCCSMVKRPLGQTSAFFWGHWERRWFFIQGLSSETDVGRLTPWSVLRSLQLSVDFKWDLCHCQHVNHSCLNTVSCILIQFVELHKHWTGSRGEHPVSCGCRWNTWALHRADVSVERAGKVSLTGCIVQSNYRCASSVLLHLLLHRVKDVPSFHS